MVVVGLFVFALFVAAHFLPGAKDPRNAIFRTVVFFFQCADLIVAPTYGDVFPALQY